MLYTLATALAGTFVSPYVLDSPGGVLGVVILYLGLFAACPLGAYLGGQFNRTDLGRNLPWSFAAYGVFYIALFLLGLAHQVSLVSLALLGVVQGLGLGLYFVTINVLTYDLVSDSGREAFFGQLMVYGGIIAVLTPAIGGAVIQGLHMVGYGAVFLGAFLLFFWSAAASRRLATVQRRRPFALRQTLLAQRRLWRQALAMYFYQGMRDGLFTFAFGLALYYRLENTATYGADLSIFAVISIASSWLVSRYLKARHRGVAMWIGLVFHAGAILFMAFTLSVTSLLTYGFVVNSAFTVWYIPFFSVNFDAIQRSGLGRLRTESLVAREISFGVGRVIILAASAILVWQLGMIGLQIMMAIAVIPFVISIAIAQRISVAPPRHPQDTVPG